MVCGDPKMIEPFVNTLVVDGCDTSWEINWENMILKDLVCALYISSGSLLSANFMVVCFKHAGIFKVKIRTTAKQ